MSISAINLPGLEKMSAFYGLLLMFGHGGRPDSERKIRDNNNYFRIPAVNSLIKKRIKIISSPHDQLLHQSHNQ